jgi:hypothetical protein
VLADTARERVNDPGNFRAVPDIAPQSISLPDNEPGQGGAKVPEVSVH